MSATRGKVFVTGATGYIGGRLVPRLLDEGYETVCLSRDVEKIRARPWSERPGIEAVEGDAADAATLAAAMRGCRWAYYLVHSMMAAGPEYAEVDRKLARTFAEAAAEAGVERIVYLGGLGETGSGLSEHLASRREVEEELASTGIPVTTLRAAMIIGSGSASFEILRYLVERLPIMVTPKWVSTECQPVAVEDVLYCLVAVLGLADTAGRTFDIGGSDIMTYREIMQTMAEALGLRRRIIVPVPVLTPSLSSLWIHLVTPISAKIARPLADGLRNRVVARDDALRQLTGHRFKSVREAIEAAVTSWKSRDVPTAWSDAGVMPGDPDWAGGKTYVDSRTIEVEASAEATLRAVSRIGGTTGYYAADWLWWIRGALDRLIGGPGLRRGRRDPDHVVYGDVIDFWRVTRVGPASFELRAEMWLPGEALLAFEVEPLGEDRSRLVQTARFMPRGLLGILYWYAVMPLHGIVFEGMLRGIARAARTVATTAALGASPSTSTRLSRDSGP